MNVTPIEHEIGRFFVTSRHGEDVYVVDLRYAEHKWQRPRGLCGCIRGLAYGEYCAHLEACVQFERERLSL